MAWTITFTRSLICTVLMAFISCNQSPKQEQPSAISPVEAKEIKKEVFKTNEIIPLIQLHKDASQSFALYLPKDYSDSTKLPVIIFFDPHGDGSVPLNLYHSLADEFEYVLIGSNSSKNGMNMEQTSAIASNLVAETQNRFSIDEKRIILCGFSGGAKVALLNAMNNTDVSSVIYCGAAVPLQNLAHPLSFLGFAGTKDMNYTDEVLFDRNLPDNISHYLVEWNGKHEWTNQENFKDAFLFLKKGSIENYSRKKAVISDEKLSAEQNFKQTYINAFQTQDLVWWKREITMLNMKKKNDMMYERLLGFISLACYSYSGNAIQQNNLSAAEKILAIYQLADPGNKDCENFLSELNRRKSGN